MVGLRRKATSMVECGGQFRELMRRCHPKTNAVMEQHCKPDDTLWKPGMGVYANLRPSGMHVGGDPCGPATCPPPPYGFYRHVSEMRPAALPANAKPAHVLRFELKQRIRDKEATRSVAASPMLMDLHVVVRTVMVGDTAMGSSVNHKRFRKVEPPSDPQAKNDTCGYEEHWSSIRRRRIRYKSNPATTSTGDP